jgi:WXG100 family type VII secretion target
MGDKIEANYEELQTILRRFQSEAEAVNQLLSQTRQKVEALHGSGWIGRGSEAFFAEMNGRVLPSMGRLYRALMEAGNAVNRVSQIFKAAEEEAKSYFTAQ